LDDTEQLNKALDMMNNAVAGGHSQPGARENVAYLASTERRRDFESLPATAVSGQEVSWSLTSLFSTNMAISETTGQEVCTRMISKTSQHLL